MATKPAHVKIAQKEGPEAGLKAYHDSIMRVTKSGGGAPPVRQAVTRLHRAGGWDKKAQEFTKPEKALAFYCKQVMDKYGVDVSNVTPTRSRRKKAAEAQAPAVDTNAALALLAQALGIEIPGAISDDTEADEDDEDDTDEDDDTDTESTPRAQYEPSDNIKDDPATNGRLWKLNSLGLLEIRDFDEMGDPITNMEAHEAIAEALS